MVEDTLRDVPDDMLSDRLTAVIQISFNVTTVMQVQNFDRKKIDMKRLISMLFAVALVCATVGCSSSESEPAGSTGDEATTEAEGSGTTSTDADGSGEQQDADDTAGQ